MEGTDIFAAKDREKNGQTAFWKVYPMPKPISHGFTHGGYLLQISSKGEMISKFYLLTKFQLVICKGKHFLMTKRSTISWKRLEMITKSSPKPLLGFRLYSASISENFYVESQQLLEGWMEALSKLCVLTNLFSVYQTYEEIGRGATSNVVRAVNRSSGIEVAIKLVHKLSQGARSCLKEVDLMRRLNHGAIMQIQSVFSTSNHIAIVLEYARGGSLTNYLHRHIRVNEEIGKKFIERLLKGISHMHNNKCVHRDIKLDNILLTSPYDILSIKISDFGLSCDLKTETLGKYCGTVGFFAPEILKRAEQCPKIDIFSAGVVIYTLLTGAFPFQGPTEKHILKVNAHFKKTLITMNLGPVSDLAKDFVMKVMAKNPHKRLSPTAALEHPWLDSNSLKMMHICPASEEPSQIFLPKVQYEVVDLKDLSVKSSLDRRTEWFFK